MQPYSEIQELEKKENDWEQANYEDPNKKHVSNKRIVLGE